MSDFERKEAPTLLALSYPLAIEEDNTLSSNVQAYSISQEPFELSDAFSSLEGRKADPDMSFLGQTLEWVVKPVEIAPLQNVSQNGRAILDLWERGGRLEGISVDKEGEVWLSHLSR